MRLSRSSFGAVAAAIALAIGVALPTETLEAQVSSRAYVSSSVTEALQRGNQRDPSQRVRVIVTFETARGDAIGATTAEIATARSQVLNALPAGTYELVSSYKRLRSVSLSINAGALGALRSHPLVKSVNLDQEVKLHMSEANALTGIGAVHTAGFTGDGVRVAIIDSGVDSDHPALVDDLVGQQCFRTEGDCPTGGGVAEDQNGHGTHVAGMITGPQGSAPDAEFASLKVFTTGSTSDTNILNALDYVLDNSNGAGLDFDLVNMSLGGNNYADVASCDADNAGYVSAFAALNAAGVALFVSTGNDASTIDVGAPGCVSGAIGVGSSGDAVFGPYFFQSCTDNGAPDKISCYSNATPVQGPGELVDLIAPGCDIISTGLAGSTNADSCGTSMATPYAAGVGAVVLEYANQNAITLSPAQLEEQLEATGTLISDYRMAALPGGGPQFPRVNPGNAIGALALDAPTAFEISSFTANSVTTSWTAEPAATEYRVYRSVDGGAFALAGTVTAPTVTFTDNAAPCGELTYHVRSYDGQFESLPSNEDSETPRDCPLAPTTLTLVGNTDVSVDLTWVDNATDETGYVVERSVSGGAFASILTLPADAETATDTDLECGLLSYRVAAQRGTDLSAYSNTVSYVPCGPENDLFENAEVTDGSGATGATADYVDTESNVNFATESPDDPSYSCGFFGETEGSQGLWYSITPAEDVRVTIDTYASTGDVTDTLLSVLTHDGTDFTEVDCNDDAGEDFFSEVVVNLSAGETYYAFVSQYSPLEEDEVGSLVTTFAFESGAPIIAVTPAALDVSSEPGVVTTETLTIGNSGGGPLTWAINESDAAARGGSSYTYGLPGAVAYQSAIGGTRGNPGTGGSDVAHGVPAPQGTPIAGDFVENFDSVAGLTGAGWAIINRSQPVVPTVAWFQGNPSNVQAHQGAPNAYVAANFEATTGGADGASGTTSVWMLTPEVALANGTELRFFTRTPTGSIWPDRLEVRLSTNGGSTDVGTTATSVGDFTTVLATINPTLASGGYPQVWTEVVATVSGLPAATSGRFALRYHVTETGPDGANGNYIGVDTLSVTQPAFCETTEELPWVSAVDTAGTTPAGGTSSVDVEFDSTGLAAGTYSGLLCVSSNDEETPIVPVPVSLEVVSAPRIAVDPASVSGTAPAGGTGSAPLVISNTGDALLEWEIAESDADPRPANGYVRGRPGGVPFVSAVGSDRSSGVQPTGAVMHTADAAPQGLLPISADFTESFDNITTLPGAGWSLQNLSSPIGGTSWFQGNDEVFESFDGAIDAYIGANFNNAAGSGTISNWLISPYVELNNGTVISFYTRVPTDTEYADRLEVRLSTAGDSTDVGATATSVGDFTTLVTTINPNLNLGGGSNAYPEEWTLVTFTVEGLPAGATGRVAMRYFVTSGGPSGANSSYIGIDAFDYVAGDPSFCETPSDIDWLSVDQATGSTDPGEDSTVTVEFDATALAVGSYSAQLCIDSNDASQPRVVVPVSLDVTQALLDIAPATLPDGNVDAPYSATITATGDDVTLPIEFSITDGTQPPGLSLDIDGTLSGTPTTEGSYTFTVSATDSSNPASVGSIEYTVDIGPALPSIDIAPATLANGKVDQPYSVTLTGSGDGVTAPISFAVTDGALPDGLTLDAGGLLSGTPTTDGSYTFTVTATDSSTTPITGEIEYTLVIDPLDPVVEITPATLPRALIDAPYSVQLTAAGTGTTAPYTFDLVSGVLPAGVTLDADGLLSGIPEETGTFNFSVAVEDGTDAGDGGPFTGSIDYTLTVVDEFIFADGFENVIVPTFELESSGLKRVSLPLAAEIAALGDHQQPILRLSLKSQLVGVVEARCVAKACEVRVVTRAANAKWTASPWWTLDADPYTIELDVGAKLLRSVTPATKH